MQICLIIRLPCWLLMYRWQQRAKLTSLLFATQASRTLLQRSRAKQRSRRVFCHRHRLGNKLSCRRLVVFRC